MCKRNSKRTQLLVYAFLVVLTLTVFRQVVEFDFLNLDDNRYTYDNAHVPYGMTSANLHWAMTSFEWGMWQPMVWLSYFADTNLAKWAVNGLGADLGNGNSGMYHLTNLVLHLANTLLLYALLSGLMGCRGRSAFVAALFAVHPLHVESVAWVAERKDVLSTFFWLLTIWLYIGYARRQSKPMATLTAISFALGLMSKALLVTLPVSLLLLDYWPLGRLVITDARKSRMWMLIKEKLPLFALAAASSAVTIIAMKTGGELGTLKRYPLGVRVADCVVAHATYIYRMFWPARLYPVYPHPGGSLPMWQVLASGAVLILITALAIRFVKSKPYLAVGWLWYVVTLFPVNGLVPQGISLTADHFTYVPLIGLFVIISWGVHDLLQYALPAKPRLQSAILTALAAALLVPCIAVSHSLAGTWEGDKTMWNHVLSIDEHNQFAQNNMGWFDAASGDPESAAEHFQKALQTDPDFALARSNYLVVLMHMGKLNEALEQSKYLLKKQPHDPAALTNVAVILMQLGRNREAAACLARAIRIDPTYAEAYGNLGVLLTQEGKAKEGLAQCSKAVQLDPDDEQCREGLENARSMLGQ